MKECKFTDDEHVTCVKNSWLKEQDQLFYSAIPALEKCGTKCTDDEDVICAKNGWLEEQDEQFFYSGIQTAEKQGSKCIPVAGDYVEK